MTSRVPIGQLAAFVLPKLALGLITAPFFYVLPTFYAQNSTPRTPRPRWRGWAPH